MIPSFPAEAGQKKAFPGFPAKALNHHTGLKLPPPALPGSG
jgi:hypothetical protein